MAQTDRDDLLSIIDGDEKDVDVPKTLSMMPVRDVVIFPDMLLPLFIGRDKSIRAVEEAMEKKNGLLFLAAQKLHNTEEPTPDDIYRVGTVGRILRMLKLPDGRIKALVQGVAKARIVKYVLKKSMYRVNIELIEEKPIKEIGLEIEALVRTIKEHAEKIIAFHGEFGGDFDAFLDNFENPAKLADLVASNLRLKIVESQSILEIEDPIERLKAVVKLLSREVELSSMQAKIKSTVSNEITKSQRDYFLREQVRAIHKELGETDTKSEEIEDYRKKIRQAKMSKEAHKEAEKQAKRLESMHPDSAESSVIRTYLDWLVEIPWSKSTKDVININKAKKILDKDHYGLNKVKDRILEHLSIRKLNPGVKGPILCFVGPPGVGKTSLGKSISRDMGREFIRVSLGGIRDEAEIRGHRRTYIGALPGRILQGLKQCGKNNPVFMLDEIDKLGSDFRGDPSSAMLEALDPEQNSEFSDHYINLPFDLSKVMFILTANATDTIPSALLDRMEIVMLSGYTEEEKAVIAKRFLFPRQIKASGIVPKTISISEGALLHVIQQYTQEAGLRNLERELGALCRKIARKIAEGAKGPFPITKNNLSTYLGARRYYPEMEAEESEVGLATGLAWTYVGGEVLYVETTFIKGKGEFILTGQLGEVMQESARAALSYTRANLDQFRVSKNFFDNRDIHIHVPAGAIPKDGPSAGIVIACSIISAITNQPVSKYIAMTGEITLRGRVLPIGGLKEKALGALRAGIHTIILPEKNTNDLIEIPKYVNRKIQFIPVKHMDEVLKIVFDLKKTRERGKKKNLPALQKTAKG
jgi:ATP-dependent Lon protease